MTTTPKPRTDRELLDDLVNRIEATAWELENKQGTSTAKAALWLRHAVAITRSGLGTSKTRPSAKRLDV